VSTTPGTTPPPMDAEQALGYIRSVVEADGGENPMILLGQANDTVGQVTIVPCIGAASPNQILAQVVADIRRGEIDPVGWALLVADAYALDPAVDLEEAKALSGQQLSQLFADGDPRVSEAVLAVQVAREDESCFAAQQRYLRMRPNSTDGGAPPIVWGDVIDLPLNPGGLLAQRLREVVTAVPAGMN
jgi:hypothetical protein